MEGGEEAGCTSISVISTPSRSQATTDFSPLATQSKSTDSPSITVLLTGGTASKVSPGTDVGNGDAPGLNDLTSLPGFRLVKRQRDYFNIRVSLIFLSFDSFEGIIILLYYLSLSSRLIINRFNIRVSLIFLSFFF